MSNIVYIACSIDGFIAKIDGNIDWIHEIPNENNNDYGLSKFMERIDGIIKGRKTFEKILEMDLEEWPYNRVVRKHKFPNNFRLKNDKKCGFY
ncbi:MAG: hypothetical protein LBF75_12235 [Treponema sp.]|jgi:dihydrofolate reductase|nr:hypothetical protein [Treponema sp.]